LGVPGGPSPSPKKTASAHGKDLGRARAVKKKTELTVGNFPGEGVWMVVIVDILELFRGEGRGGETLQIFSMRGGERHGEEAS